MDASWLQHMFQMASVIVKIDGIAPDIISNVPSYIAIGRCHSYLKSCHGVFVSPGNV